LSPLRRHVVGSSARTAAPGGATICTVAPWGWHVTADGVIVGPTTGWGENARARLPEGFVATSRFPFVGSYHASASELPSEDTAMLGFAPFWLPGTGLEANVPVTFVARSTPCVWVLAKVT